MSKDKKVVSKISSKKMTTELKAIKILQVFVLMIIVILAAILVGGLTSINRYVIMLVTLIIEALLYKCGRNLKYK